MRHPPAICARGMITSLGLHAEAVCAAMRAGIRRFRETSLWFDGEPIHGGEVPLREPVRGRERCLRLLASAVRPCLDRRDSHRLLPILLCVASESRPGRGRWLDEELLMELHRRLEVPACPDSRVFKADRVGGVDALAAAVELVAAGRSCVLVGVDNLLVPATLEAYHRAGRLFTARNSNGLRPGEAAAAVRLQPAESGSGALIVRGLGRAAEPAFLDSGEPLRGEGLAAAISASLVSCGQGFEVVDYRIADLTGEEYGARESALALARVMRTTRPTLPIWLPGERLGEIGAATVPLMLGWAAAAAERGYAPGNGVLVHVANDDAGRGAVILTRGGS